MKILTEINRSSGINVKGKTICRTAVRGVIMRGRNLLMIYSSNVGDYKFPGGGVTDDETHAQALSREIQEECGTTITHIGLEIGAVSEYDVAVESEFDTFKMTSRYYQCEVQDGFGIQKLDEYEQALGFKPVWIDIDQAIRLNKELLHSEKMPKWLRREIFILDYIRQNLLLTPEPPSASG